jgi:hypothetical protein
MANLTQAQRDEVWAAAMQFMSAAGISTDLTKGEMADVVAALDEGIGDSTTMVDMFLGPQLAAALDQPTKFRIFAMVVERRLQEGI